VGKLGQLWNIPNFTSSKKTWTTTYWKYL